MNKILGDNYEIQIRDYIINILNKKAYLWHHVPETILIENGIIGSHNQYRLKRIYIIQINISVFQLYNNIFINIIINNRQTRKNNKIICFIILYYINF